MQTDNLEFGERLKQRLDDIDMKQIELSKLLNIPASTLNAYFTGRSEPDIKTIIQISQILSISIEYLMTGRRISHSVPLTELAATLENPKLRDTYKKLIELDPDYLELADELLDAIVKKQRKDNK